MRPNYWKLLGVAGVAGVAATGVVVARRRRAHAQIEPDEIRERLHARLAEVVAERRAVVEDRGRLPDLPALVRGRQRRRDRRPGGHRVAARLPRAARRRRDLAVAGLSVAAGRQRLRHLRLPGHRAGVRDAGGVRPAAGRDPRARDEAGDGPRGQPHLVGSIHGSSSRARRARTRSATGTGGATSRPTTGARRSPARRGSSTRPPPSTTCTSSPARSPTSTGRTRRCGRRSTR